MAADHEGQRDWIDRIQPCRSDQAAKVSRNKL